MPQLTKTGTEPNARWLLFADDGTTSEVDGAIAKRLLAEWERTDEKANQRALNQLAIANGAALGVLVSILPEAMDRLPLMRAVLGMLPLLLGGFLIAASSFVGMPDRRRTSLA